MPPGTNILLKGTMIHLSAWLSRHFGAAVRTAIRIFKPFLDAMIAEDMLAFWETQRGFVDALGSISSKIIVADDAT
jgi:hypothetical protein